MNYLKQNIIIQSLAIAVFIFIVGSTLIQCFHLAPGQGLNQWQENRIRIEHYLFSSTQNEPRCVITGSSLSTRIKMDVFDSNDYNLALAGGSAFTGLSTVAQSEKKPLCVLIESNLTLKRAPDTTLIQRYFHPIFHTFYSWFPLFREGYQPAVMLASHLKRKQPSPVLDQVASNFDEHLNAQLEAESKALTTEELSLIEERLTSLIKKIQSRGIKAMSFDVPRHPKLLNSSQHLQLKRALTKIYLDLNVEELKIKVRELPDQTEDGQHLTHSSARRFSQAFAESLPF